MERARGAHEEQGVPFSMSQARRKKQKRRKLKFARKGPHQKEGLRVLAEKGKIRGDKRNSPPTAANEAMNWPEEIISPEFQNQQCFNQQENAKDQSAFTNSTALSILQ